MQTRLLVIILGLSAAVGAGATLVLTGVVPLPGLNSTPPFPDIQDAVLKNPGSARPEEVQGAAYSAFEEGKFLTALSLAQDAAARGDPQAYTLIGRIYAEGAGVARDDVKAAEAYDKAAELGDVPAMVSLGVMLAAGQGVTKDRAKAADLFERAARTGDPLANYNLGLLFLRGEGKPENPHRAAQHIRYAAEKDVSSAQYDMATLYQSGTGVPNDALEAARWMSKAAASGLTEAQYDYAVMLLRGQGLKADEGKAIDLLKTAAEKGVAGAQNRLAHVYFEGIGGIEKSFSEAAKWRLIAKSSGIEKDDKMELMMAALTPDQISAAEKAAADWLEKRSMQ